MTNWSDDQIARWLDDPNKVLDVNDPLTYAQQAAPEVTEPGWVDTGRRNSWVVDTADIERDFAAKRAAKQAETRRAAATPPPGWPKDWIHQLGLPAEEVMALVLDPHRQRQYIEVSPEDWETTKGQWAAYNQHTDTSKVAGLVKGMRQRDEAKRIYEAEKFSASWRVPEDFGTLADELALPEEETSYLVDRVWQSGGNVLLTAQFKAGKTTLVNNLVRSLADGTPFLGQYKTAPVDGRIAIFNYEVEQGMYRRWLRDQAIVNADKVVVLHLRGKRLPLIHSQVEDWVVQWLKDRDVRVWVVDPFARAYTGCGEENDNTAVGVFLDTLDVIKDRAGVTELIMPVHTGRAEQQAGAERARGATRLDDWTDGRWLLTRQDDTRYLRITGRDIDEPERPLTHDPATRHLTVEMEGGDRKTAQRFRLGQELVELVRKNPGLGVNEITQKSGARKADVSAALRALCTSGELVTQKVGQIRGHYAPVPGSEWFPAVPGTGTQSGSRFPRSLDREPEPLLTDRNCTSCGKEKPADLKSPTHINGLCEL